MIELYSKKDKHSREDRRNSLMRLRNQIILLSRHLFLTLEKIGRIRTPGSCSLSVLRLMN